MIIIDAALKAVCPSVSLGCFRAEVGVEPSGPDLLRTIEEHLRHLEQALTLENIHTIPAIQATRQAYKALGNDPSRYRPSAEALLRRVVQGKGLYSVNNVVDMLNLISIDTGISIGGYDFDNIQGNIRLCRGEQKEPYQAIGRGQLNIHNLPVLRDDAGAFGSPTSDSERTQVTTRTKRFLAVFFRFGAGDSDRAMRQMQQLLALHASGNAFQIQTI